MLTSTPPVGGQPLRPAGVDTDPHFGIACTSSDFSILGDEHDSSRATVGLRYRHDPVAQPFDDQPAGVQEGDSLGHPPQQREGGIVTQRATTTWKKPTRSVSTNVTSGFAGRVETARSTPATPAAHSCRPRAGRIAIPQQPTQPEPRHVDHPHPRWTT